MIFVQHRPGRPLDSCVRLLWYCKAPCLPYAHERVLPRGEMQIILNLAADTLADSRYPAEKTIAQLPHSIVVGPRGTYELVDTADFAELLGIVFRPGGAAPFLRERAAPFFEKFIPLDDIVSSGSLRDQLREQPTPAQKLATAEQWLLSRPGTRPGSPFPSRNYLAVHGLDLLRHHSVREAAQNLTISERRLHQILTAEVGLSPKLWSRITRFQQALHHLQNTQQHWEQLALDCGYYDQSHFCNEFRSFSGIDPSTYTASPRIWSNHVPED